MSKVLFSKILLKIVEDFSEDKWLCRCLAQFKDTTRPGAVIEQLKDAR